MIRANLHTVTLVVVCVLIGAIPAIAQDTYTLKGKMADIEGRPMEGAKLFLYDSSNVRRPADFISALSDSSGLVKMILPPGKYWAVARFKADGKYGPLLPGDKHSGDPLEIDMAGDEVAADFVIADIRELGQKKRAAATDAIRLKGKILDIQGVPVANAYLFASRSQEFGALPDFVSAWTGADGVYELYLPPDGIYYAAAARQFPLVSKEESGKPLVIERGKIDIAIDIDFTVK
jgi:hypothetical protein